MSEPSKSLAGLEWRPPQQKVISHRFVSAEDGDLQRGPQVFGWAECLVMCIV